MTPSRFVALLGVTTACLAMAVGIAGAVNVTSLPNSGFEAVPPCSPLPNTTICGWNDLVGTMSQDTIHHSGSFSMKLTGTAGSVEATTAGGVCVTPISPGQHFAAFWYLTSSPVADVQLGAHWYPNATCTVGTFDNSALHAPTPITYGAWTQVTGTLTAPPTTGSAFFSFFASCQCNQPGTVTAYFDDVAFSSTSAVTVRSLTASRKPAGVLVRWRTGSETGTLGFHVYRRKGAKRVRVDRGLIPTKGSVSGARYSFLDARAPRAKLVYLLQAVGADGSRTWNGRVDVAR
jgi:hypothetical protein